MSLRKTKVQELTTDELMEAHCVSQQNIVEESLSEGEEVTAKQQSSGAIREMLKAWETVTSYIEKHHPDCPNLTGFPARTADETQKSFALRRRSSFQLPPFIYPSSTGRDVTWNHPVHSVYLLS
ncbi:hypothetical protein AVEN_177767-1 [Araneus ventricosus]|uniref:Uncharacterized protein n=1 Tax=Araneus ventricosus TaxID=182803 RepID=A0A4Y2LLK3_ARAVE|nr:hypothetical protein AVEN_177767-1 [Araneus ventricosus]